MRKSILLFVSLFSGYLSIAQGIKNSKAGTAAYKYSTKVDSLIKNGWIEEKLSNGDMPECYESKQIKDSNIDNYLKINVGKGAELAAKLMLLKNDSCIRYVFVKGNSFFIIKNIPEGEYYLKLALGKDWLSDKKNNKCKGMFIDFAIYEKQDDVLDFNIVRLQNGYQIPSYEIWLDVISNAATSSLSTVDITADEFNK